MIDVEQFLDWYSKRRTRQTGHAITQATRSSMASRLRTAYRASACETPETFAAFLSDHAAGERLLDELSECNSTGSLRLVYEACKAYHAHAQALGMDVGAFAMEKPAKNPSKPVKVYTDDEVEALLGGARGRSVHWWAFLCVLAHTGRRLNEVLGLRWDALCLDADKPYFNLPTTKSKQQAYVPLDHFLAERVFTPENIVRMQTGGRFKARSAGEYVFPWASEKQVRRMMEGHCARVGVAYRGFHIFRHTFATNLLARGVPMHVVSKLVGHSQTSTTDRVYNHTTALTFAEWLEPTVPVAAPEPAEDEPVRLSERTGRTTATGTRLGVVA